MTVDRVSFTLVTLIYVLQTHSKWIAKGDSSKCDSQSISRVEYLVGRAGITRPGKTSNEEPGNIQVNLVTTRPVEIVQYIAHAGDSHCDSLTGGFSHRRQHLLHGMEDSGLRRSKRRASGSHVDEELLQRSHLLVHRHDPHTEDSELSFLNSSSAIMPNPHQDSDLFSWEILCLSKDLALYDGFVAMFVHDFVDKIIDSQKVQFSPNVLLLRISRAPHTPSNFRVTFGSSVTLRF
nr:putative F-box/kelch-repeat protein At3g17280 [Ipomoea batatas]